MGALALVHLAARRRAWEGEALLLALAALGGYAVDSGLVLAGLLGAVAGPLAYQAGARLGGASLGEPAWVSWTAIGLAWLVAMPLLVRLAEATARLPPARAGTGPREGARP